eukprot:TRINITY_DN36304_c0_g1_i1.p1 TRINITY_DN36304_c0_g1~~TRINITY_DN36304_c0_g1_i1.p1  ORF type:complete len:186 (+),score=23.72 TRINITY_DN36304_c0_g1_i1:41-598(+)
MPEPKPEQWSVYAGSIKSQAQRAYYRHQLLKIGVSVDLAQLVASFADEGFSVGQLVDVQDGLKQWCVAQILDVQHSRILVHYVGWHSKFDECIFRDFNRVERLFARTAPPVNRNTIYREPTLRYVDILMMLEEPCLGIRCPTEALDAFKRYGNDFRSTINGLVYENLTRTKANDDEPQVKRRRLF